MDAVELPLPAAVTVSKLMGSDGCGGPRGGEGGVTVNSSGGSASIGGARRSFHFQKDALRDVNTSKPAFWNTIPDKLCRHASQLSSNHGEGGPSAHNIGSTSSSLSLAASSEAKQLQQKSGKMARTNSNCSKRSRLAQMEVSLNINGIVDMNSSPNELGSYPSSCNNMADKMHTAKQKYIVTGKRGDKRNGKTPKSKCDSFSVKAGLLSFSSAAGGSNIIGVYGSKPETSDFTEHLDELSLGELLDGSYSCPSFDKDKGKKIASSNENILQSVREAYSVLRPQKLTQPQNMGVLDSNHQRKVSACLPGTSTPLASRNDDDKVDSANQSSSKKDFCSELATPANTSDFPLYRPKDILDRLALPPSKDLDLLLLDAAKPTVASRNNSDLRLGKMVAHQRGGLPTFPWSHVSGGHAKSNSDTVKVTTSRSICQGRWVKIGNCSKSLGDTTGCLVNLESLTYDQNLVPSGVQKPVLNEIKDLPSASVTLIEQGISSSGTCSLASRHSDEHSPILLAAAQTLCDLASHPLKQDQHGMTRWPKKPSQKAMGASKLKLDEKSEKVFGSLKSRAGSGTLFNCANETTPLKKLRLSATEKSEDPNLMTKAPLSWSAPRSSRSFPCKSYRETIPDNDTNRVKKPLTMPHSIRLDKAPKMRKLMPMGWNRPTRRLE